LTQVEGNLYSLSTGFITSACDILADSTTLHTWPLSKTEPVFRYLGSVETLEEPYFVGEYFELYAPTKYDFVTDKSEALQTYFYAEPPLPEGLSLVPSNGFISGTFATASASADYYVYLRDPITLQTKLVLTLENLEVLPLPESGASIVSPAAYAVPVAIVLLAFLIVYLYVRNDMKKEYHIFISYRGLCIVTLFGLQGLGSGH
jgi:hypothetical protein